MTVLSCETKFARAVGLLTSAVQVASVDSPPFTSNMLSSMLNPYCAD